MLRLLGSIGLLLWLTLPVPGQSAPLDASQTEVSASGSAGRHDISGTGSSAPLDLEAIFVHTPAPFGDSAVDLVGSNPGNPLAAADASVATAVIADPGQSPIFVSTVAFGMEGRVVCDPPVPTYEYSASWNTEITQTLEVTTGVPVSELVFLTTVLPRICPVGSLPTFVESEFAHELSLTGPGVDLSATLEDDFYFLELPYSFGPLFLSPGLYTLTYTVTGSYSSSSSDCCTPRLDFTLETHFVTEETVQQEYIHGDVDADGLAGLGDGVAVLQWLFANGSIPCTAAADVNGSGSVDLPDAVTLFAFLFLSGEPPAHPYPDCGTDAHATTLGCDSFPFCP